MRRYGTEANGWGWRSGREKRVARWVWEGEDERMLITRWVGRDWRGLEV